MSELSAREKDLLERVKKKPELRPLFLRKVKGLKWFSALKEAGYLNAESIPKPFKSQQDERFFVIPAWTVGEYLVKTSPELRDEIDYVQRFLKIVSEGTEYAREKGFSNYRVWYQFAQVVSETPSRLISEKFIDNVVDYWLSDRFNRDWVLDHLAEKWFPGLLEEKDNHAFLLALKLLGVFYKLRTEGGADGQSKVLFRVGRGEINEITGKVAYDSGHYLGARAASVFRLKLEEALDAMGHDSWSSAWQPSMKESSEIYPFDPGNVLVKAYRECLDGWFERCPQEACGYLGEMIENRFQTIQRLAIHFIADRFSVCREHTEKLIDERFFGGNYLRESWHFINRNYVHFDQSQKDRTIEIIENRKIPDTEGNLGKAPAAYRQAVWLAAVKDCGEREKRLYEKAVAEAGAEPDPSEFLHFGETQLERASEEPGYSDDELRVLSPKALAGRIRLGDIESARVLRSLIKASPLRYYGDLGEFMDLGFPCLHTIIKTYSELWEEKASLPWNDIWGSLLEFFFEIVKLQEAEKAPSFTIDRSEVIRTIAGFLESGAQSDDHCFHEDHHAGVESIIDYVLKNEKGVEFEKTQDKVFTAINSPRGTCIQALINLTLRSCRLLHGDGDDHSEAWERFQHYYDAELKRADSGEYEFSTLVTVYLSNFLYMSRRWVLSNLDEIFDQGNYMKWLCAMEGYSRDHSPYGIVYQEIYNHLSEKGDLLKALDDEKILQEQVKSRVVENIAHAYIRDFETLEDSGSMIRVLVTERRIYWELDILVHAVIKFQDLQEVYGEKIRSKIYELWPLLTDVANPSSVEGRVLASSLCRWSVFVDHLDKERMELLLKIAPYADESYNTRDLLESLARLSGKQPFKANEIWLKILERSAPVYPEEPIRQILANLIAKGHEGKRAADETVDEYIKRGVERPQKLLVEILNKF